MAVDINPDTVELANNDIKVFRAYSSNIFAVSDSSVDIVFASNFFEHLERSEIIATLDEVSRILKPAGSFLILQPSIRFCKKDYWMFFDRS